jgi:hypothetical protein
MKYLFRCYTKLFTASTALFLRTCAAISHLAIVRMSVNAKVRAQKNALAAQTLSMCFSIIGIEFARSAMVPVMFSLRHQFKIAQDIIRTVAISVVDYFVTCQATPKMLLHYKTMHPYISTSLDPANIVSPASQRTFRTCINPFAHDRVLP